MSSDRDEVGALTDGFESLRGIRVISAKLIYEMASVMKALWDVSSQCVTYRKEKQKEMRALAFNVRNGYVSPCICPWSNMVYPYAQLMVLAFFVLCKKSDRQRQRGHAS